MEIEIATSVFKSAHIYTLFYRQPQGQPPEEQK